MEQEEYSTGKRSRKQLREKERYKIEALFKARLTPAEIGLELRREQRIGGDFSDVFKTITADNGSEFSDNAAIKKAARCDAVYYAHPYRAVGNAAVTKTATESFGDLFPREQTLEN